MKGIDAMSKYVRLLALVPVFLIALWIGNSFFKYFTHNSVPKVEIIGVRDGGVYKGIINCFVEGDSDYKVSCVSVFLDNDLIPIDGAQYVKSKKFNLPFKIDTSSLVEYEHTLKLEAVDSSYKVNKLSEIIKFYVDNVPLKSAFMHDGYKVEQGKTLHLKMQLNKQVDFAEANVFSQKYCFYPESENSTVYECFIPIDCEQHPDEYLIEAKVIDRVGNHSIANNTVKICEFNFPRQKGFTVSSTKLNNEKEISMDDRIKQDALGKWLNDSPRKKLWSGPFEVPTIVKRLSTPYGEIRVTPQRGRYYHKAVDIVNNPNSVIWASQNGKVIIKDRYLLSGNTVIIDHGLGVFTKYFHLNDFADIEVGDFIKKGEPVGKLGMTGYANGPHLHWELTINNVAVDPFEWTKKIF